MECGLYLQGESFGAEGTQTGEIVFNTSLSGYQEIITDPSYAMQFIAFTMPEIGITGVNADDMESRAAFCQGIIVRNYNALASNFRAEEPLSELLKRHDVLGISGIDTRLLVKTLRTEGSQMMIASTEISDPDALKAKLQESQRIEEIDCADIVTTDSDYIHEKSTWDPLAMRYREKQADKKIVAIDFGIKRNILNELTQVGFDIEVIPAKFSAESLIARFEKGEIKAVFLSNGPGDPMALKTEQEAIKKLIAAKIPMFAICLGHQLLSIAHGYPTTKLKFGHHGGNHPVQTTCDGAVMITAQNHNYNVPETITEIADVTHVNLFDNTIEGLHYKESPIFSYQHHPEASPGPTESSNVFQTFYDAV